MEESKNLRKRAAEALEIAAKMKASADKDAWLRVADEFSRLAEAPDKQRVLDLNTRDGSAIGSVPARSPN